MNRSYKLEGIIIKVNEIGEIDNRLTILSNYSGLVVVLAKGIRRINSRRSPHLDLINHINCYLYKGKSFDIVTDVSPIDHFSWLKTRFSRVVYAYKLIELVNRFLVPGEEQNDIFQRLLIDLHKLNSPQFINEAELTEDFANFLLWQLGFLPRDKKLTGLTLDKTVEELCERKIYSNLLISKLQRGL